MTKRIKVRMCVSCRNRDDGRNMFRIVYDKESMRPMIDHEGKYQGRGAYLCRNTECIRKAQKQGAVGRHLKCDVGDDIFEEMVRSVEKDG